MYICGGSTLWATLFTIIEYISIFLIAYLYTSSLIEMYKNGESSCYEKLDLILIGLSILQIYVIGLEIISDSYIGLNYLLGLFKFSENSIVTGCLLFQIMLWQHHSITLDIVKYFLMGMIVFDIVTIGFIILFEPSFFEPSYCQSTVLTVLVISSLLINFVILLYALYKRFQERSEENITLLAEEEDQYNLSKIIQKYTFSIRKMKNYYIIIIVTFTLSYLVDIYWKLEKTSSTIDKSNTDMNGNITILNSTLTMNNTMHCDYYGNFKETFQFGEFLFCNFSYILKDLVPHIYIYISLFRLKHNMITRSSSLIEPL
jgi:hypothetical protein